MHYDVEADIAETRVNAEHHLKSSFETELAYWNAMDEKRYDDAKIILQALVLMRKNEEVIYQLEAINWQLDLAGHTGDIEMFLGAIASIPETEECELNEDSVRANLKQLLFSRGKNEVRIAVSPEGQRRLARETLPIDFLRAQIDVFTTSLLAQIATGLLLNRRMTVHEFTKLIETATEESRASFLAVHPFITDLIVVWKK